MLKTEIAPTILTTKALNAKTGCKTINSRAKRASADIFETRRIISVDQIQLVSLFCGAGGLDLGFKQSGFRTAVAFDINQSAVDSFNNNHPGNVASVIDIEKAGAVGILNLVKNKISPGADIGIIGGPPCQGFSLANVASKANDPRNKLPRTYLKIVKELMSTYNVHFLLIENVSGIKAQKHNETFSGIINGIKDLKFTPHHEIMNSVHYGVPQVRKRMILLGLREQISKNFKFPEQGKVVRTVREVIGNFPEPVFYDKKNKNQTSPHHANHWTMMPKSEKFRADYVAPANSRSFKRVDWDTPSKTIAFGNREILVHPSGLRRLSIYEALLLQGFPESFTLVGTLSSQVTQVSNAVPPPLAKSVADSLKQAIVAKT